MRRPFLSCQKAPSAKRCIKTQPQPYRHRFPCRSQKAPSAKRCIKTRRRSSQCGYPHCALQKAPSAKRCIKTLSCCQLRGRGTRVRKHRAPKGALRPGFDAYDAAKWARQKAPSAKRCIKTHWFSGRLSSVPTSQKAPSAKRCIKTALRQAFHSPLF